jgi:Family of unknown function (DUF6516)
MKADLLLRQRIEVEEQQSFAELVIWQLPHPLYGSTHLFKYRLAYVVEGVCVLRYDNESGKGDHRHADGAEMPYRFSSVGQLLDDFWQDVEAMR